MREVAETLSASLLRRQGSSELGARMDSASGGTTDEGGCGDFECVTPAQAGSIRTRGSNGFLPPEERRMREVAETLSMSPLRRQGSIRTRDSNGFLPSQEWRVREVELR